MFFSSIGTTRPRWGRSSCTSTLLSQKAAQNSHASSASPSSSSWDDCSMYSTTLLTSAATPSGCSESSCTMPAHTPRRTAALPSRASPNSPSRYAPAAPASAGAAGPPISAFMMPTACTLMSVCGDANSCRMRGTSPPASCSTVVGEAPSSALGTSSNTLYKASRAPSSAVRLSDSRHATRAGSKCGQPAKPAAATIVAMLVPTTWRSGRASLLMATSKDALMYS
mmetsp:Transcript_18691/g.56508  ORF Transcript_18691/g.56508 Transcript_18691/m.56508 type:complete len:225 (+) Transcript_18691:3906-4580(+)